MADAAWIIGDDPTVRPRGAGPLYLQLKRRIEDTVASGGLRPGEAIPSERKLALSVKVSRVTVRKAVQHLVRDGILIQRHGSGTFVAERPRRVEQSLSRLTSFTEDMVRRGLSVRSVWLDRGHYDPAPEETIVLGLSPGDRVARVSRLRVSGDTPLAIERAVLPSAVLPDVDRVGASLYAHLQKRGMRPIRALQRIRAMHIAADDARLLEVEAGAAALQVERTSYLGTGRIVEFTRSIYRGDTYDFVAELHIAAQNGDRQ